PVLARGNLPGVDRRNDVIQLRAGNAGDAAVPQEARHIEHDKRQHDQGQTPLEPALVPAHPIEHCHRIRFSPLRARLARTSHYLMNIFVTAALTGRPHARFLAYPAPSSAPSSVYDRAIV